MAMHAPAARLHHHRDRGRPHRPVEQRRGQVQPGQHARRVRLVQPVTRQPRTRTAAITTTCLDLVADLPPSLLLFAILALPLPFIVQF